MTTPLEKAQQRIQEWIANGNCKEPLHLSHLGLTEIPEDLFMNIPDLTILLIENNQLTTLPENIFIANPRLTKIDISYNQLTSLPENLFLGNPALEILFLDGNRLRSLPETLFLTTSNLGLLSLSDNRLTRFPESLFTTIPHILHLYFDGNPLAATIRYGESIPKFMKRLSIATFIRDGMNYDAGWLRRCDAVRLWSELAYA